MRRAAVFGALLLAACEGAPTTEPGASVEPPAAAQCRAIGSLADLEFALEGGTAPGSSEGTHPLARVDEELAYLEVALAELRGRGELGASLTALREAMQARRGELGRRTAAAAASFVAAEAALDEAATCRGADLREKPEAPSKRCRPAARLWAALRSVDLTSPVSSRAAATHIVELTLDPERAGVRDRVADALLSHAFNLQQLADAADIDASNQTPATRALALARIDAADQIGRWRITCLEQMRPTPRVLAQAAAPRHSTVVVRPKWPQAVEAADGAGHRFGSGFVVRWRATDGTTETRIVTNDHVMGGAVEAEIIPGDEAGSTHRDKDEEPPPIIAHLVRSVPRDDIAILRVEESPRTKKLHPAGIGFRLEPAREQERVTAAGFPGVSGSPSFQVTEGIVSNAKFNAAEHDRKGVAAFIQHTAAIDPGNSGGPLLDARGRLLGMNALKIFGRENVGLAIPTARIQIAMARADTRPRRTVRHAEAACNMALAALANPAPDIEETLRFGLALHESFDAWSRTPAAARYRESIDGPALDAVESVRTRLYAGVKASLEAEGGVRPYTVCTDVHPTVPTGFTATFHTATGEHTLVLDEEGSSLRVAAVEPSED